MATILVADDFLENRDILCRMLELVGHRTVSAANGQEALDLAQTYHPDVILMDLSMPVLDGWEATARLKALDSLRHVPVLAVTGHVTPHEIQRAIEAGCVDYIAKPIDFDLLIGKVTSLLNDGKG
ncbi:response regulator [Roseiflexus castenholzii]|jgi:CheY-like chemotaxis protein|uniref:Response regulator receiver protein n=1 Tax=Roseiflexus castenholzii (strain DSM 13941 / HLO8) TaxID=383372 RepID=A7NRY2_ROSCS|nr:response regulator [Roseiflexus castenholzii]ABU60328.1 response regulator receiver protein [Roseiflexus castenholzii DSM 13941]